MRDATKAGAAAGALALGLIVGCGQEQIPLAKGEPPPQPSAEQVEKQKKTMPARGQISQVNPVTGQPSTGP